ncbi:MAG: ABC transporter ATP-binding protein [Gammaproteobacteria bacterium]|nr:ABC transporter ATP-binding protein [Gammaproteobacteria bacterium]
MSTNPLIKIEDLHTFFYSKAKQAFIRAVDGISMEVPRGKTLGIVGESGSGKSITMMSVLGLISAGPGVIRGKVIYDNGRIKKNLLQGLDDFVDLQEHDGTIMQVDKDLYGWQQHSEQLMKNIRGNEISIIFQNPKAAFNPFTVIGEQIAEMVLLHTRINDPVAAKAKALYWLERVKMDAPEVRYYNYPGALSGGMAQRAMVAMALASEPALLIADEPTTGLDATIQAKVLQLLAEIKADLGITIMIISHDIGVISSLSDYVAVMYGGTVLEYGSAKDVLSTAYEKKHPYAKALLASIPGLENIEKNGARLKAIKGEVLDTIRVVEGCKFASRCDCMTDSVKHKCNTQQPPLEDIGGGHKIRCWLYQ